MDTVSYIGEHLWLGTLGHLTVLLAFVSALYGAYAFFKGFRSEDTLWKKAGRAAYWTHSVAVWMVMGLILYAMISHWYEYDYVYRTVSDDSPMRFLLAAFWADQEGSFLLWMFWHCVLGLVMMYRKPRWSMGTMATLCLIQAFLSSMLLGLYLPFGSEDFKFGSNPFILVRDVYQAPIFANADYLTLIQGRGLNPLLQNYWMTIHPPVLFLGFASMSIPFCMAIAGLSTGYDRAFLRPLLRWSLFAAFIFGLGLLMGAAWAYEALTFGGYWAWDPVENTSLVPWLVVVAGIHTNLIAKATGYSIKTTYAYYLLGFVLVVYSTFLTRSGILGDTSVHAFTTMGLETQLALFIAFFAGLGLYKYFFGGRDIPKRPTEEAIYSREFWMFVGSLVLLFSGILMTVSTSLPVYNKIVELWNENHVPLAIDDPMSHHNKYQIWIGIFMGLLSGSAIYLRYQGRNWSSYRSKLLTSFGGSALLTTLLTYGIGRTINTYTWQHHLFLYAGLFTMISNLDYLVRITKSNLKMSGAAFSHMGFGVLILGIMFSGLNKKTITGTPFLQGDFAEGGGVDKATILIEDLPFYQGEYWMNYVGDTLDGHLRKYQLEFKKVDQDDNVKDQFTTYPSALYQQDFSKIAALNPGNERKLLYDVFVAAAPNEHLQDIEVAQKVEEELKYLSYLMSPGEVSQDSFWIVEVGTPLFDKDENTAHASHRDTTAYDLTFSLPLTFTSARTEEKYTIHPGLAVKDAFVYQQPEVINDLGIKVKLSEEIFSSIFTEEANLDYEEVILKPGGVATWRGFQIELSEFNRDISSDQYTPQEGDIAIGADLKIINSEGLEFRTEPIYILRNAQQFSIKSYDPANGFHARFSKIDPQTEMMTFKFAVDERDVEEYEVFIAEGMPRSDILIVEANIFPGINLVWVGCLMMLAGLLLSLIVKRRASVT